MTPDDILSITEQDHTHPKERYGDIMVPLLGVEAELVVLGRSPDVDFPQIAADRLTAFLSLGPKDLPTLADALALHCRAMTNEYLEDIEYPSKSLPNAQLQAINWRHFGLNADGSAPDGWVEAEWLNYVNLIINEEAQDAVLGVHFLVPWEPEHGATIGLDAEGKIRLE